VNAVRRVTLTGASLLGSCLVVGLALAAPASASAKTTETACVTSAKSIERPPDTRALTAADRRITAAAAARYRNDRSAPLPASVVINVRAHVLKSTNRSRPFATTKQIADSIRVLNEAYAGDQSPQAAPTRYSFHLYSTTTTTNTAWAWARQGSADERAMKQTLRQGHDYALNLYFVNQPASNSVLGWSTFPQDRASRPKMDGVVINVNTLPGAAYQNYNEGDTATHEVGHWLGLYHTFENGCSAPGDEVADTPAERDPSDGCPVGKNTCPTGAADPIHNFMDYSYDACMNQFTAGQAARIDMMWSTFRAP
jgi:hypothetical protein